MGVTDSNISRRSLLRGAGLSAAGVALAGILGGCSSPQSRSDSPSSSSSETVGLATGTASATLSCDIVVVGLGASGLLAAYGAAKKGADVIGIDIAGDMTGVTNVRTSAPFAVGSRLQSASPAPLTIQEAMDFFNNGLNYQLNQKALRNILEASGKAVDTFQDHGMEFKVDFSTIDAAAPIPTRGDCWYGTTGEARAAVFSAMMEDAGVDTRFNAEATGILLEDNKVVGVQAKIGGTVTDIKARAVIVCTGGFLGNEDLVAEHFSGSKIVCMGNSSNKGAGIQMCQAAGGQIGKCFSISMNEYGGANAAATPTYSFRPTSGSNEAMRLPVFGGLLVDAEGSRFINEGFMCEKTMFAAEPIVREGYHYAICDEAFMKRWESEPLPAFLGDARMKSMFDGVTATDIRDQFATAEKEGWVFHADTLAEIAEHFGLTHLEETVQAYNGYCAAGFDEQFFKDASFLSKVTEAPFYVVQSQPAGWLSLGGIKTDAYCQVVDSNNKTIDGLYIAGADADLFPSPYYCAGMANGFSIGSGLVAGERAAEQL